jgi:hypothetical protein
MSYDLNNRVVLEYVEIFDCGGLEEIRGQFTADALVYEVRDRAG